MLTSLLVTVVWSVYKHGGVMEPGAGPQRFGSSTALDIQHILSEKDAKNTKKATKVAVQCLRAYILETNTEINIDDCNPENLASLLRSFYVDARKKDSSHYKLSALKSIRFGLSRFFKQEMDIDIIKDPLFQKANEVFQAVTVDLKRKGMGKTEHTVPIEVDELKQLYQSKAMNPDTPVGLQQKVWFDIMFYLCRRGRENLRTMNKETFAVKTDHRGSDYVCQVSDELDKNHRENVDPNQCITEGRMYENPGHRLCPVASYRKYLQRLNPSRGDLWQRPKESFTEEDNVWYMDQAVGKNTLSGMMKTISKQAGLSREFNNHAIRATSITVLDINKFEARDIMKVSGHRSETSIKHYSNKTSETRKHEMSSALSDAVMDSNEIANSAHASHRSTANESCGIPVNPENLSLDGEIFMSENDIDALLKGNEVDVQVASDGILNGINYTNASTSVANTFQNSQHEVKNILSPIENMSGILTPYITGCVVNFNINVNK